VLDLEGPRTATWPAGRILVRKSCATQAGVEGAPLWASTSSSTALPLGGQALRHGLHRIGMPPSTCTWICAGSSKSEGAEALLHEHGTRWGAGAFAAPGAWTARSRAIAGAPSSRFRSWGSAWGMHLRRIAGPATRLRSQWRQQRRARLPTPLISYPTSLPGSSRTWSEPGPGTMPWASTPVALSGPAWPPPLLASEVRYRDTGSPFAYEFNKTPTGQLFPDSGLSDQRQLAGWPPWSNMIETRTGIRSSNSCQFHPGSFSRRPPHPLFRG